MREIVLDTETTGLDPHDGHRIVEVACIELVHHVVTGRIFHRYVNPERDMPEDALAVHGLTAEFLARQPPFAAVLDELLGGRQPGLEFAAPVNLAPDVARVARAPRPHAPSADELAAHLAMLKIITEPLWLAAG